MLAAKKKTVIVSFWKESSVWTAARTVHSLQSHRYPKRPTSPFITSSVMATKAYPAPPPVSFHAFIKRLKRLCSHNADFLVALYADALWARHAIFLSSDEEEDCMTGLNSM